MSKIFQTVLGGSKKKASSQNVNNNLLTGQLGGSAGFVPQAGNAVLNLLGAGGDPAAQTAALNNFKDSSGFNFIRDQGIEAIKGGTASQGLFNSGATGEALSRFGTDLASTTLNDFIKNLLGAGNLGLGAAGVLAETGKTSQEKATEKPGIGGLIGQVFAGPASSDRRLKMNIISLRTLANGLGLYSYQYIGSPKRHVGVMADEVERIAPEALGPTIDGYKTVDYSKLTEVMV